MIVDEAIAMVRSETGKRVRERIVGPDTGPATDMASAEDPGLFGPASSAWRVHGSASMFVGGVRSLLLQTLHPLAMAGVSDHSDYRHDPWGRLNRTAQFVGTTTFGNTKSAERNIKMVRNIHKRVEGTAPDGRTYSANDPHLLSWVHITEVDSFLRAFERYGEGKLTDAEKDSYVAEMAQIAIGLGAEDVPTNRAELNLMLDDFRPELEFGDQAKEATRFLLSPPVPLALAGLYGVVCTGSVGLLPSWARSMMGLYLPSAIDSVAVRPAATILTRTLDWLLTAEA